MRWQPQWGHPNTKQSPPWGVHPTRLFSDYPHTFTAPSLPTQDQIIPRFPEPKNKALLPPLEWELARLGILGAIQRLGLQGPHSSSPGRRLAPQHRSTLMPAQHPPGLRDREGSSATGSQEKAKTRGGKASLQTKRTEVTSQFAGLEPGGSSAAAAPRAGGEPGPGAAGGHHPPAFPGCLELPRISPGPAVPKAAGTPSCSKARESCSHLQPAF